jgi:hypothetical protein
VVVRRQPAEPFLPQGEEEVAVVQFSQGWIDLAERYEFDVDDELLKLCLRLLRADGVSNIARSLIKDRAAAG